VTTRHATVREHPGRRALSRETRRASLEPVRSPAEVARQGHRPRPGHGLRLRCQAVRAAPSAVYSELDHGPLCRSILPPAGNHLHPLRLDAPKPLNTELGCTVLVVDDEEDLLEIATAYLEEMGIHFLSGQ